MPTPCNTGDSCGGALPPFAGNNRWLREPSTPTMHPEVQQRPSQQLQKYGMTLEPVLPTLEDDDNLRDFQRRFWWTYPSLQLFYAGHVW